MAPGSISVALLSGKTFEIQSSPERPLSQLKLLAMQGLQTGKGILRDAKGQILDESKTKGKLGLKAGDALTLQVRQTTATSTSRSWAAILGDGSVVTWGDPRVAVTAAKSRSS